MIKLNNFSSPLLLNFTLDFALGKTLPATVYNHIKEHNLLYDFLLEKIFIIFLTTCYHNVFKP